MPGEWVGAHHRPIDVVGDMLEEGVSIAAPQARLAEWTRSKG